MLFQSEEQKLTADYLHEKVRSISKKKDPVAIIVNAQPIM